MSKKAIDPEVINKNNSHKPIDYEKLNRLTEDFGKCFTPQQELSAEQDFWLRMSNPTSKSSDALPVKIEALKELPKISLNEDLKAQIQDNVFVITSLKNDLQKIKGKEIVDIASQIPSANSIVSGMFKLDFEPLAPSKCGSKPTGNKRNDRISQTTSRNIKNKVEAQPRKVNKKNCVVKPVYDVNVKHSLLHANSEPVCATCKKSLFDGVHDICFLDFMKNVNSRAKSAEKHKKENIWRPIGHVFTKVGLKWKPTGRTFTIVGNMCHLTRITSDNVVPPKTTTSHTVESQKLELKVYSRKLKSVKNIGSSKKAKIVESKNANYLEPNHTWGSNATDIPLSSSSVMTGYPDCSLVSGLRMFETHDKESLLAHELSSKTKSWLWHRRLSHLNFGTINKLAKDGLARGIPRLKFQKDHLCSACALGKSKTSSHQPKAKDTNQEKIYLLHMDLCGPMRVASINGKRIKDEAPEAIIKCIKNIQVHLNATVRNVRTDNGTEFFNQTLREFYENVGISHQTSVARTPQQNSVVERRN
ncbi:retrovirus-related pol polyprotein from transposon TNT 1-94 [Tanacetum coccineum]